MSRNLYVSAALVFYGLLAGCAIDLNAVKPVPGSAHPTGNGKVFVANKGQIVGQPTPEDHSAALAVNEAVSDLAGYPVTVRPGVMPPYYKSDFLGKYTLRIGDTWLLIKDDQLSVDDIPYGPLKKGDSILVDNARVYVSGESRTPMEDDLDVVENGNDSVGATENTVDTTVDSADIADTTTTAGTEAPATTTATATTKNAKPESEQRPRKKRSKARAEKTTTTTLAGYQVTVRPGSWLFWRSDYFGKYILNVGSTEVSIKDDQLYVNDIPYGPLKKGESIVVESTGVQVSGETRKPRPKGSDSIDRN
jgi:hypothetical protein